MFTIPNEHIFFLPRLEEEFYNHKVIYESKDYDDGYFFIFPDTNIKERAKEIYKKLQYEFKYDIEINRLEDLLFDHIQNDKCIYYDELDELISKEIYLQSKRDMKIRRMIDNKKVFILEFDDLTYKDFMSEYDKLHKKMDYVLHNLKQKILSSDDFKIKKINLLSKILALYNIQA